MNQIPDTLRSGASKLLAAGLLKLDHLFGDIDDDAGMASLPCCAVRRDLHLMHAVRRYGGLLLRQSESAERLVPLLPHFSQLRSEQAKEPFIAWMRWRINQGTPELMPIIPSDYEWAKELRLLRSSYSAIYVHADWIFAPAKTRRDWARMFINARQRLPNALQTMLSTIKESEIGDAAEIIFPTQAKIRDAIVSVMSDVFSIETSIPGEIRCERKMGNGLSVSFIIDLDRPTRGFSQRGVMRAENERISIECCPLCYSGIDVIEWDCVTASNLGECVKKLRELYSSIIETILPS